MGRALAHGRRGGVQLPLQSLQFHAQLLRFCLLSQAHHQHSTNAWYAATGPFQPGHPSPVTANTVSRLPGAQGESMERRPEAASSHLGLGHSLLGIPLRLARPLGLLSPRLNLRVQANIPKDQSLHVPLVTLAAPEPLAHPHPTQPQQP